MANQPSIIPSAWAANNSTTETIPATTSESGKASWDQGFPVETSLPLSEGGIPPKYGDFNGVLNVLSQFCLFAQAGGQYAWSNTLDYSVGSIVLGTDGSIYRAAQVSGPSTTAVNPVGDTSGKWERLVSQSDINAIEQKISDAMDAAEDAASNASAAQSAVSTLDANVVKKSGDQTVGGVKTFSDTILATNDTLTMRRTNTTGALRIAGGTGVDGTTGAFLTLFGSGHSNSKYFRLCAGTMWLEGRPDGTLTWGGNDIITNGGNQTIAGNKTFSGNAIFNADIGAHNINPKQTNTYSLGYASGRWKEIWQTNGTLTGSDERIKSSISTIPDAVLDAWADVNWAQFQMVDSVEMKGEDKARLHTGLVAQRIAEAFSAHGLDACRYGLFCYDEWDAQPEKRDDEGNVVREAVPAGDAFSLRYDECLCLEAAYQRRRADRAEARISALERRLGEMEAVLASLISPVGDETYAEPEQEQDAEQENEE